MGFSMIKLLVAVAAFALTIFPAQAALSTIYIIAGVHDNGGAANTGFASTVSCINASGATQTIQVKAYGATGGLRGTSSLAASHGQVRTFSTHGTAAFAEDDDISPGLEINGGSFLVLATSPKVYCSAWMGDAALDPPASLVELHVVRFNPVPGTAE